MEGHLDSIWERLEPVNVTSYFNAALMRELKQNFEDRYQMIRKLNPAPHNSVYVSAETLLLGYEGMGDEMRRAAANCKLGTFAESDPFRGFHPSPQN